jgi:hypothetical protein
VCNPQEAAVEDRITITKLVREEGRWTCNVNGIPVMSMGQNGRMSIWVTVPRRSNQFTTREVLPEVRKRIVDKVRREEKREESCKQLEGYDLVPCEKSGLVS